MSFVFENRIKVAKESGFTLIQCLSELEKLYDLIAAKEPKSFLEIGSACGGSLYVLAGACAPGASIIVIELDVKQPLLNAINRLHAEGFNVTLFPDISHRGLTRLAVARRFESIDFVHIDGDHSYGGVESDYRNYGKFALHNGGTITIHDICGAVSSYPYEVKTWWGDLKMNIANNDWRDVRIEEIIERGDCFGYGVLHILGER